MNQTRNYSMPISCINQQKYLRTCKHTTIRTLSSAEQTCCMWIICLCKCSIHFRKFLPLSLIIYHTCRQCGFLENNSVCPLKQGSMGIFLCHPRFSRILSMAPLIAMTGWPLGWSPSGIYSFHWLDLCHPTLLQTLPSREFNPKAGQELLPADV